MTTRIAAAVIVAAGCLAVGVGAAHPVARAQPVVTDEPVLTDEDQIRDVLTRQADASAVWDLATAAELTCTKSVNVIPGLPTSGLSATDVGATLRTDPFTQDLIEQISGAAEDLRRTMTGAADQPGGVRLASVDHITIDGDTATADVTMTVESGANPPQTQITRTSLLRQNGQWCTTL